LRQLTRRLCASRCWLAAIAVIATGVGCRPSNSPGNGASATPSSTTVSSLPLVAGGSFADVTETLGITFQHTNGPSLQHALLETAGGGCAFLDYDGDGWQDVLLVGCGEFVPGKLLPPNTALYHNDGGKGFTDVTPGSGLDQPREYGQGVAVGDYDNDGKPDIYIAGYGGCRLFHNEYAGSAPRFVDVTQSAGVGDVEKGPRWAAGAVWGDFNRDSRLDLFVYHYAVWTPENDKKCLRPDGTPTYCSPNVFEGDSPRLYLNKGSGVFVDVSREAGFSRVKGRSFAATTLDFDGDGFTDIYVANDMDPNHLLRNDGKGHFEDVAFEAGAALGADGRNPSGMGAASGDYDNSGRESVFVPNLNGESYSLYHNDGDSLFSYVTDRVGLKELTYPTSAWGVAFFDYNRDGWRDLVCGNGHVNPEVDKDVPGVGYEEPVGLFTNNGKGRFVDGSSLLGAMARRRSTRGLAVGDYDNDGRQDVLCVNRNARADLFRNTANDSNHWLTIRLVGTKCNRDAAGARVWVVAGGQRWYAECRLGSSYASSPDKRLYFGLGSAKKIEKVEVVWPVGTRETFSGPASDQIFVITQGGKCVPERFTKPTPASE
jgi:enediyne biosynthesis protein E4